MKRRSARSANMDQQCESWYCFWPGTTFSNIITQEDLVWAEPEPEVNVLYW